MRAGVLLPPPMLLLLPPPMLLLLDVPAVAPSADGADGMLPELLTRSEEKLEWLRTALLSAGGETPTSTASACRFSLQISALRVSSVTHRLHATGRERKVGGMGSAR